jgi:hypothetical protein
VVLFRSQFMTITPLERAKAFWAEMSAREHFVQIYQDEDTFVNTLTSFVDGALQEGFTALVVATPFHHRKLEERLSQIGHDLATLRAQDQYISLNAEATIGDFMVNGSVDGERFLQVATDILARATKNGRKVRAFGEMVAIMWAKGFYGATVKLEYLWHQFCTENSFAMFCAYPEIGFAENGSEAIAHICAAHSKILAI